MEVHQKGRISPFYDQINVNVLGNIPISKSNWQTQNLHMQTLNFCTWISTSCHITGSAPGYHQSQPLKCWPFGNQLVTAAHSLKLLPNIPLPHKITQPS